MESFVDPTKRYRLFFDETGTGDLTGYKKDPNQQYLSLTGVVIQQEVHDNATTQQLTNLKKDVFGPENANIILHRRDIVGRVGVFQLLEDEAIRKKFDEGFHQVVMDLPGPVFTVSIDKKAHLEKYAVWQWNPYHYVMTCLLERFVLWLNASGKVGDVMGEARNPTHDAQLRRSFRWFYDHGTQVRKTVIRRCLISRELRLEPKKANIAALQIADLLAHPAHRSYKFIKLNLPIPDDYGASLVKILEIAKYNRHPTNRTIEGYGRKWLP